MKPDWARVRLARRRGCLCCNIHFPSFPLQKVVEKCSRLFRSINLLWGRQVRHWLMRRRKRSLLVMRRRGRGRTKCICKRRRRGLHYWGRGCWICIRGRSCTLQNLMCKGRRLKRRNMTLWWMPGLLSGITIRRWLRMGQYSGSIVPSSGPVTSIIHRLLGRRKIAKLMIILGIRGWTLLGIVGWLSKSRGSSSGIHIADMPDRMVCWSRRSHRVYSQQALGIMNRISCR